MFELIEIVVGLESIISWVEDVGLFFLDWLGGLIVALEPAPDLRHIDGGTTRCSPPPIRKGGFDEPHLLRSPVSGHGKRTQLALERGQGWR